MTDSIYTIALFVVSAGMTVIAGVLAYLYRQRDGQFAEAAKQVNALTTKLEREELLTKRLDESGKRSEETADYYVTRCEKLQDERDTLRRTIQGLEGTQTQLERIISDLSAERSTLYRRNAKGQIEPITPKPRKPHTLKHGMTVKDPTPQQAKRIFAEARKAGIHLEHLNDDTEIVSLVFSSSETNLAAKDALLILGVYVTEAAYITPTEFIRRIRGEQE